MNKYEVLGMVGEGAYGVVLRCRNKETDAVVAIKKFKDSNDSDETLIKTTQREIKILKLLKHPNIVTLLEGFKRKNKLYLVFEFVDMNLLQLLEQQSNGLEESLIQNYIYQLVQAISFCHSHNVIHRDIKPENLLVSLKSQILKLCDFGFARILNSSTENDLTDYVATRWYRAPELLIGSSSYTMSVDIWAIGCIMGEITDSQPLFPGDSEIDQLYLIQKVIGPLIPEHLHIFQKNERFSGFNFPDMSKPETLSKKYSGKMSKRAMSFMNSILLMNPKHRLTSTRCLDHKYFNSLNQNHGTISKNESSKSNISDIKKTNILKENDDSNSFYSKPSQHEMEKEIEREQERAREQEIRALREFSKSLSVNIHSTLPTIAKPSKLESLHRPKIHLDPIQRNPSSQIPQAAIRQLGVTRPLNINHVIPANNLLPHLSNALTTLPGPKNPSNRNISHLHSIQSTQIGNGMTSSQQMQLQLQAIYGKPSQNQVIHISVV